MWLEFIIFGYFSFAIYIKIAIRISLICFGLIFIWRWKCINLNNDFDFIDYKREDFIYKRGLIVEKLFKR